jgi:glucokinase
MARYVVGVDFGGTHLRAALIDEAGTVAQRSKRKTEAWLGPAAVIARIADAVRDVMVGVPPEEIVGVGVIAPGPSNPYTGVVLKAPNLDGWELIALESALEQHLGIDVWLGNDANLAALAEHRYGAGRGYSHLIYITVSTGIGGGIIIDNKMLLGAQGLAAEIGHMQIIPDGPVCGCGNHGCVEAVASGPNIARIARQRIAHGAESSLSRLGEKVSTEQIVKAAQAGDALAIEVLADAGGYVGMAVANLIHIFNPQRIIIGGGVSNAGDLLFEPIRKAAKRRTMPVYHGTYDIVLAELGDDVGLLGAGALAFANAAES